MSPVPSAEVASASPHRRLAHIFGIALRLGLTSFGGPIAHLGYFHEEYVKRRRWLDETSFAQLVALCQFLPGPASSQLGIAIGFLRGGYVGGILSWLGFTLPSAVGLALFATLLHGYDVSGTGWLRGLLIVAVPVVAHAVWGMATRLTPDRLRQSIALVAALAALLVPTPAVHVALIALSGLFGWLFLSRSDSKDGVKGASTGVLGHSSADPSTHLETASSPNRRRVAWLAWAVFLGLLIAFPVIRHVYPTLEIQLVDAFYRVGSLVFGGGHVVLPLLAAEVVGSGWLSQETFLAGYGAAQAVPGPLFTFSAYIGTAMGGWAMGALALVAIFLPSYLLVIGTLPFWGALGRQAAFRAALSGVNAAVVGILLAALYDPIWTKAIHSPADFALALLGFALLAGWRLPAWAVVVVSAAGGLLIEALV